MIGAQSQGPKNSSQRLSLYQIAFFLFCVCIASVPSMGLTQLFTGLTVPSLLSLLAAVALLLQTPGRITKHGFNGFSHWIPLIFWILLTYFWAIDRSVFVRWMLTYLSVAWTVWVATQIRLDQKSIRWLFISIATGLGLAVAVQLLFGRALYGRTTIGNVNANFIAATYCEQLCLLLAMTYIVIPARNRLAVALTFTTVTLAGILFAGTRGAIFVLIPSFVLLFLPILTENTSGKLSVKTLVWILIPLALLVVFSQVLPAEIGQRFASLAVWNKKTSEGFDSNRFELWPVALALISNNILTGVGPGGTELILPGGIRAHNVYLSITSDLGVIGMLAYLYCIARPYFAAYQITRGDSLASRILLCSLVTWVLISLVNVWEVSLPGWLMLMLAIPVAKYKATVLEARSPILAGLGSLKPQIN